MSDASKLWGDLLNDAISILHGKPVSTPLAADAQKFLSDIEGVASGLTAAGPYAPAIITDVAGLVAQGTLLVATKGADLPAFLAAGADLQSLAADLAKAEAAFLAGMNNYKAAAAIVAAAPAKT